MRKILLSTFLHEKNEAKRKTPQNLYQSANGSSDMGLPESKLVGPINDEFQVQER